MVSRGMVDWRRGGIGSRGIGVDGSALVGDLGHVPTIVVGRVAHCLDTPVREGHRIGAWMDGSSGSRSDSVLKPVTTPEASPAWVSWNWLPE